MSVICVVWKFSSFLLLNVSTNKSASSATSLADTFLLSISLMALQNVLSWLCMKRSYSKDWGLSKKFFKRVEQLFSDRKYDFSPSYISMNLSTAGSIDSHLLLTEQSTCLYSVSTNVQNSFNSLALILQIRKYWNILLTTVLMSTGKVPVSLLLKKKRMLSNSQ
jgi:hypothetical protein